MVSLTPSHSASGEKARSAHWTLDSLWDQSRYGCCCWK